jgi:hypothetical protein
MEKIVDFVKSLFSPKALRRGIIVGTIIGLLATKIISIAEQNIHIGEFFAAMLVGMYFLYYCLKDKIKLAISVKMLLVFLIVLLLSIDSLSLIRQPILLVIGGGQEKNVPPYDTYSYMISYCIVCVFIGGLIETFWGVEEENFQ